MKVQKAFVSCVEQAGKNSSLRMDGWMDGGHWHKMAQAGTSKLLIILCSKEHSLSRPRMPRLFPASNVASFRILYSGPDNSGCHLIPRMTTPNKPAQVL